MPTIFTKIINGEIPSYKIAENDQFYAFLDINPLQIGHTLIVPKQEIDYYFDLDDETIANMNIFAKVIAAKMKTELQCKKVAVLILGLEVPHAHMHLIPVNDERDVDFNKKLSLTKEDFQNIQYKLTIL